MNYTVGLTRVNTGEFRLLTNAICKLRELFAVKSKHLILVRLHRTEDISKPATAHEREKHPKFQPINVAKVLESIFLHL